MTKRQIGIKLDDGMIERVDQAAAEQKLSRTAYIEAALADRLVPGRPVAAAPAELKVSSRPEAVTLEDGTRVFPPPEGADPDEFWARVSKLASAGMPRYNASKVIRQEMLGVPSDGERRRGAAKALKPARDAYLAQRVPQLERAGMAPAVATAEAAAEFRMGKRAGI